MTITGWRALLFVPAGSERMVQSAIRHRPDAVILDLEDGVARDAKAAARAQLRSHQAALAGAGIDAILRVNGDIVDMVEDLGAAQPASLAAVMVPKCSDDRRLRNAAEILRSFEGRDGRRATPLLALVESPAALPALDAISQVPGLIGMMFGPEDYAAELGTSADSAAIEVAATLTAAAAAARGLLPIGLAGSLADFTDLAAYASKVARARSLGFRAAAAIHPAQLPALRAGFQPDRAAVEKARRIVAAFESAAAAGRGVVALDGAMLDAPVVEQARRLLEQAAPQEGAG